MVLCCLAEIYVKGSVLIKYCLIKANCMVRNIVEGVKFVKFNCIMMVYILSTHLSDYFVIHKNQFLILLKPKQWSIRTSFFFAIVYRLGICNEHTTENNDIDV
jgi:hypothetical protein